MKERADALASRTVQTYPVALPSIWSYFYFLSRTILSRIIEKWALYNHIRIRKDTMLNIPVSWVLWTRTFLPSQKACNLRFYVASNDVMVLMRYFLLMRYLGLNKKYPAGWMDCGKRYSYDGFGGRDWILFKIYIRLIGQSFESATRTWEYIYMTI